MNLLNNDNCERNGNEFILLSTFVSLTLAKDLSSSEQGVLDSFLQVVGQNLTLISIVNGDC